MVPGHTVHAVEPAEGLNDPTGHARHAPANVNAPVEVPYLPAGHSVHARAPWSGA